jgi:hypothetical protein
MNTSEFKAWFEGFTEGVDRAPTAKQWARIKARVEEIKDTPTPAAVFYRDYWPYRGPYYGTISGGVMNCVGTNISAVASNSVQDFNLSKTLTALSVIADRDSFVSSSQAFSALGRAEAASFEA